MDLKLFLSTFLLIFIAELPDKTAIATLLMATRGKPAPIFVGVALAFVVQTLIAVLFGSALSHLPEALVHLFAGVLFVIFAALAWYKAKGEEEADLAVSERIEAMSFLKRASASFLVIFIAEWGDLTQLASASLVARFKEPMTIFFASVLALWTVTGIAVTLGRRIKKHINPVLLQRVAAVVFAGVGIFLIGQAVRQF